MGQSFQAFIDSLFFLLGSIPWHWVVIVFHAVLAPLTTVHAMLYKRDSRAALGWVAVCILFPVAGPLSYFLFGVNRIQTEAKRLLAHRLFHLQVGYERGSIGRSSTAEYFPDNSPKKYFGRVSDRLTTQPLVAGNDVRLLQNGEETFPAIISAIDNSKSFVFLCTYIFETDKVGREIIDALVRARQRGIDVRVIIDGIGGHYSRPRAKRLLRKAGISVAQFLPPKLLPPTLYINLRNHRKILVIDGVTGFTGGMNLGGRHILNNNKSAAADIHFYVSGPVVRQLQETFEADWKFITKEVISKCSDQILAAGNIYCRCISDGPNEDLDKISLSIKTAIATAREEALIITPYFLPSREMVAVFQSAALRGVKITIILPRKSNLRFVDWATRNMLWELLQYEIKVMYQPAPFSHSKLLIVDKLYAQIGSANLDPRSLRLNFELNMEVIGDGVLYQLLSYAENIKTKSVSTSLSEVDSRSIFTRIRDAFCWLFLPYL